mmetsp:Transcript_34898/g.34564  ORF Transcript_34898/g.34564 Transcript_34898/m.34564 type:complete len:83 (-) Transcript_34898:1109-1357(-)
MEKRSKKKVEVGNRRSLLREQKKTRNKINKLKSFLSVEFMKADSPFLKDQHDYYSSGSKVDRKGSTCKKKGKLWVKDMMVTT